VDGRLPARLSGRGEDLRQVHRQEPADAKIGVLYQNERGKNYFAGLRVGLGAKKTNIVSAQPYDLTNRAWCSRSWR